MEAALQALANGSATLRLVFSPLSDEQTRALVDALARSPRDVLERAVLTRCRLRTDMAVLLANTLAQVARRVVSVNLSANAIEDPGAAAFAAALSSLGALSTLNLSVNPLTDVCARDFLEHAPGTALVSLDLRGTSVSTALVALLAEVLARNRARHAPAPQRGEPHAESSTAVGQTGLSAAALRGVAAAQELAAATGSVLPGGSAAAGAASTADQVAEWRAREASERASYTLSLASLALSDASLPRVTGWLIRSRVVDLDLTSMGLTAAAAAELCAGLADSRVRALRVDFNDALGDAGARSIIFSALWPRLAALSARAIGLGSDGAAEFAGALARSALDALHLSGNAPFSDATIDAFVAALPASRLLVLRVPDGSGEAATARVDAALAHNRTVDRPPRPAALVWSPTLHAARPCAVSFVARLAIRTTLLCVRLLDVWRAGETAHPGARRVPHLSEPVLTRMFVFIVYSSNLS